MYNFGKKIVWIFVLVLFILGNNIFAQEKPCDVEWAKRSSLWLCKCPEWKKEIDKKCLPCSAENVCCGIQLNTSIPFIWDCIEFDKKESTENQSTEEMIVTQEEAFPTLMGYLIKILVTIIMLWSFIAILAGGVMISAAWSDDQKAAKWRKLIINVAIAIALLWASWVILRLINPNFFQ